MGTPPNGGSSAARSALADAAAGVAGSLASMLAFYPVDVYKTNLQAGRSDDQDDDDSTTDALFSSDEEGTKAATTATGARRRRKLATLDYTAKLAKLFANSFRGVHYKTAHTVASSFAYFFIYSWLTSRHRTYVLGRSRASARVDGRGDGDQSGESGAANSPEYNPSTAARLLLAAVAAMTNTTLTLPLDVLSARSQTGASGAGSVNKGGSRHSSRVASNEGGCPDRREGRPHSTDAVANAAAIGNKQTKSDAGDDDIRVTSDVVMSLLQEQQQQQDVEEGRQKVMERAMDQAWDEVCSGETTSAGLTARRQHVRLGSDATDEYATADEDEEEEGFFSSDEEEKKGEDVCDVAALNGGEHCNGDDGDSSDDGGAADEPREGICQPCHRQLSSMHRPISPQVQKSRDWTSLWSGLWPSLLLCANPSIHYTVFDTLKSSTLRRKAAAAAAARSRRGRENGTEEGQEKERLTMAEAFLLGLVAKFAATILTYPLIRAKVMLMCSSDGRRKGGAIIESSRTSRKSARTLPRRTLGRGDTVLNFGGRLGAPVDPVAASADGTCSGGTDSSSGGDSNTAASGLDAPTLWGLLRATYQAEGIAGLYRGCNLQLVHTVLKSALLMMVRERIAVTARRLLLPSSSS